MIMIWKLLIGPGVIILLKLMKVEYDSPENLVYVRLLYGFSQTMLMSACCYIAYAIQKFGDDSKTLKIPGRTSASLPGEENETELTYKQYDMQELVKLAKNFALGTVLTVVIHFYMAVVPALLLQIVTQPVSFIEHSLFSIYILKRNGSSDARLKRPFPDNSPAAQLEAINQQARQEKARVQKQAQETPVQEIPPGGTIQTSLSSAEKRHARGG